MVQYTLPAGATAVRTAEVRRQVTDWFLTKEKANTDVIFTVDGFSFSGSGQNAGMAFVSLKNWSQRKGDDNTAQAIALRATKELGTIRRRHPLRHDPAVGGRPRTEQRLHLRTDGQRRYRP
ncbi:efflux RND transporter permease subunit [Klebsiella pneumoniae subsp. pneumoniae]|nr:efflux RND transporter permease subunit [Klebsiella pneumoniae subsp. pneumoniae]